jgi:hypothetical protein
MAKSDVLTDGMRLPAGNGKKMYLVEVKEQLTRDELVSLFTDISLTRDQAAPVKDKPTGSMKSNKG